MTNYLRVVLILLGASLVGLLVSGQAIYSRLSYFFILLIAGNWAWSRLSLRGIQFERRAGLKRGYVGQIFEERFDLRNTLKLPRLLLEVQDQTDLPGSQGSRVLTLVGGRQGRSYLSRTRLVQRGAFRLGPTSIASGDPFGFFPASQAFPAEASLLVYPMMVEVRAFPGPPGLLPGGEALRRRTHQVTPNAATVREYAPGDALNRMHWKSTARRDKLMVKEFELDPLAEVWLFLDGERSVQAALPYKPATDVDGALFTAQKKDVVLIPSTEEYGASIAASLARYYLRRGRAVGLMTSGDMGEALPPDRGARQLNKMLEALALMKADGSLPIEAVLTSQARHLPRGSTLVVITPSIRSEITLAMDQLLRLGLRPVAVLVNADSFNGAPGTDRLKAEIASLGVPVTQVNYGDGLADALSAGAKLGSEIGVAQQIMAGMG